MGIAYRLNEYRQQVKFYKDIYKHYYNSKFDNIYNVLNIIADVFGNASEMSSKLEMLLPALLITNVSSSLIKT